jgi:hypothetical protein
MKTLQRHKSHKSSRRKAQEDQHFYTCCKASRVRSSERRRKAKVEAFGRLKFFQVWKEAQKLRRSIATVGWADRFWTVDFHVQRMHRGNDLSCQI